MEAEKTNTIPAPEDYIAVLGMVMTNPMPRVVFTSATDIDNTPVDYAQFFVWNRNDES